MGVAAARFYPEQACGAVSRQTDAFFMYTVYCIRFFLTSLYQGFPLRKKRCAHSLAHSFGELGPGLGVEGLKGGDLATFNCLGFMQVYYQSVILYILVFQNLILCSFQNRIQTFSPL